MARGRGRTGPTLSGLVAAIVALAGWMIGLSGLSDNSFLTHLATGQLMWDTHRVPTTDPYTFTAAGRSWIVQSWLASALYGGVDRLGGTRGLLLLMGVVCAALATLVWMLSKPAQTLVPRLAIVAVLIAVGSAFWAERPLTLGLIGLCAVLLCAEGRLAPKWLVPIFWLWANVHGSFPLGLVALGALAVGRRLDGERQSRELDAIRWGVLGCLLAAINPIGPKLLIFPIELVSKQDILRHVVEWQAPQFTNASERAFLVLIVLAIAALVRRPTWRAAIPMMVFLPLALLSTRNIAVASIVVVPGLASGCTGFGSLAGDERRSMFRVASVALVAVAALAGVSATVTEPLDLRDYPVGAVAYAQEAGLLTEGSHLVTQDFVGNFIDLVEGPHHEVFIDDRFDMLPRSLLEDYVVLLSGQPGWEATLERYDAQAVLWERKTPLAELLAASSDWTIVYKDAKYIVARRR